MSRHHHTKTVFGPGCIVRSKSSGQVYALGDTHFTRLSTNGETPVGSIKEYREAPIGANGFTSENFDQIKIKADPNFGWVSCP